MRFILGRSDAGWRLPSRVFRLLTVTERTEARAYCAHGLFAKAHEGDGVLFYQPTKTGYASWYGWSIANWGSKWGAQDTEVIDDGREWGVPEIKFETAWAPPHPIFAKLHESGPDVSFEFRYRLADDHSYPHFVKPSEISQQIPSITEIL